MPSGFNYVKAPRNKSNHIILKKSKHRSQSIPVLIPVELSSSRSSIQSLNVVYDDDDENDSDIDELNKITSKQTHTITKTTNHQEHERPSGDYSPPVAIRSKSVTQLATFQSNTITNSLSSNTITGAFDDHHYNQKPERPQSILRQPEMAKRLAASNNELFTDIARKNHATHHSVLVSTSPNRQTTHLPRSTMDENEKDELFDPSLVFVTSYRCLYYDMKKRIRKGKLFLSFNEFIFKCSGMPFVKCHLKFDKIRDIHVLKSHDNIKIYSNIKSLNKKFKKFNPIVTDSSTELATPTSHADVSSHHTKSILEPINSIKHSIQNIFHEATIMHTSNPMESKMALAKQSSGYNALAGLKQNEVFLKDSKSSSSISSREDLKSTKHASKNGQPNDLVKYAIENHRQTSATVDNNDSNTNEVVLRKRDKRSRESEFETDTKRMSKKETPTTPNNEEHTTRAITHEPLTQRQSKSVTISTPEVQVQHKQNFSFNNNDLKHSLSEASTTTTVASSKTTSVTIFLFIFMLFFVTMNFFKLNELEREISNYNG